MDLLKRVFDILLCCLMLCIFMVPMIVITLAIKMTSEGPVIHWSDRVGFNNTIFKMPKFRSMKTDAPDLATHLLVDPDMYLTPIGGFLRKSSLDELPQLWSILKGDMSFIGPRPALHNQSDLIALRTEKGIHKLIPGITGWAQINGRDDIPIPLKVKYEEHYIENRSFLMDVKILYLTALKVIKAEGVKH